MSLGPVTNTVRGNFVEVDSSNPTLTRTYSRWEHTEYPLAIRVRGTSPLTDNEYQIIGKCTHPNHVTRTYSAHADGADIQQCITKAMHDTVEQFENGETQRDNHPSLTSVSMEQQSLTTDRDITLSGDELESMYENLSEELSTIFADVTYTYERNNE